MKYIYFFFAFFSFVNCNSQTTYEKEFEEAKSYVKEVFKNSPSEILNYVKLGDGRLRLCKTNDPIKEFDNDWSMFYKIIRRNDKIIFISKSDDLWGGIGDSKTSYDYYFNEKGILVGAKKTLDLFLEDTKCTSQIKYSAFYKNMNSEKLDKSEEIRNADGNIIDFNSANCKGAKKNVANSIGYLDKISFRSVEDFMKDENIKYYNDSKVLNEKKNPSIGNLLRVRGSKAQESVDEGSKIGVDRKLLEFIPGTMGRGGNQPAHNCSVSGSISISYVVDKSGNVISAKRMAGISDACVISTSISWIKQYVKAEKSNTSSSGIYKIVF